MNIQVKTFYCILHSLRKATEGLVQHRIDSRRHVRSNNKKTTKQGFRML